MNQADFDEYRESFVQERIAIMIHDGGLSEEEAVKAAGECWERYRRVNGLFRNEQGKI